MKNVRENMHKNFTERVVNGDRLSSTSWDIVMKKQTISECILFILVKIKEKCI